MTMIGWPLVEIASRLLQRDEREAVLGDLAEANQGAWRGLLDVLGLFFRQQAALWKDGRPWLAGFGVAVPCTYLLMHVCISVNCTFERLVYHKSLWGHQWPTGNEGYPLLLCHILLLIAWSWTGGFVVGSISRRTLWVSAALCAASCVYCLTVLCISSPSRFCIFLFLPPAILGVRHGLRIARIPFAAAVALATCVTALMISAWTNQALWILNWALIWPVWYLVATAARSRRESPTGSHSTMGLTA